MGGLCSRTCPALFGDDSQLNPKLRPPPLLGVLFFLISTFCIIIWVTSFRLTLMNTFFCFVLLIFYGAIATGEGSAWERSYPSVFFLTPIAIGSALLPFYIGVKIYVKIQAPYFLAVSGREYTSVPPMAITAEYWDAGILWFSDDAALDTERSFGYKGSDVTYCVAPVVSRDFEVHPLSGGPKVTFWAVGKDCCGSRRGFECDGAGETEVRSAFTVRDISHNFLTKLLVPRSSRPEYLKAVEAAKAMHNLRSEDDENIILVRWAADPLDTLEVWTNRAKIACGVSCILYGVFITCLWSFIHWWFDSEIRKRAGMKDSPFGFSTQRPVKNPFMVGDGAA